MRDRTHNKILETYQLVCDKKHPKYRYLYKAIRDLIRENKKLKAWDRKYIFTGNNHNPTKIVPLGEPPSGPITLTIDEDHKKAAKIKRKLRKINKKIGLQMEKMGKPMFPELASKEAVIPWWKRFSF